MTLTITTNAVRRLWTAGLSTAEIAERLGVSRRSIQRRIHPSWLAERGDLVSSPRSSVVADAKRQLAALPPDTRNLTQRLMGDPPAWRSALAQKRAGEVA